MTKENKSLLNSKQIFLFKDISVEELSSEEEEEICSVEEEDDCFEVCSESLFLKSF